MIAITKGIACIHRLNWSGSRWFNCLPFVGVLYLFIALLGLFVPFIGKSEAFPIFYFGYPLIWIIWLFYFILVVEEFAGFIAYAMFTWLALDLSFLTFIYVTSAPGGNMNSQGSDMLFLLGYGVLIFPAVLCPGAEELVNFLVARFEPRSYFGAWAAVSSLGMIQTTFLVSVSRCVRLILPRLGAIKR